MESPRLRRALDAAAGFFFAHTTGAVRPSESPAEAAARYAYELAAAEIEARNQGLTFLWEPDHEEYGWHDDGTDQAHFGTVDADFTGERWDGYSLTLYDGRRIVDSIGGVTFEDNDPDHPYRRVVEAELADGFLTRLARMTRAA